MTKQEREGMADLLELSLKGSLPDLRAICTVIIKNLRNDFGETDAIDSIRNTTEIEEELVHGIPLDDQVL